MQSGELKPVPCTRLCDFCVDPVTVQSALEGQALPVDYGQYERCHDHNLDGDQVPALTADPKAYVLGLSIEEFAGAVAALSDSEELVLALVHPLVQVYSIRATGQLAYAGHICNFRQRVTSFISKLPTLPQDMPFVNVRPRSMGNRPTFKAPFKVNVHKLRHAFLWLQRHNPYYHDIEWRDSSAAEWEKDDVQLPTREEPDVAGEGLQVNREIVLSWFRHAGMSQTCGEAGYPMGSRLVALMDGLLPAFDADEPNPFQAWNMLRTMAADTLGSSWLRAASSMPLEIVALVLHEHGQMNLRIAKALDAQTMLAQLQTMPPEEWSEDYAMLRQELLAIFLESAEDEPLVSAGVVSEAPVSDDVGTRSSVLDSMADTIAKHFPRDDDDDGLNPDAPLPHASPGPEEPDVPALGSALPPGAQDQEMCDAPGEPVLEGEQGRKFKYPRVDAPEVEDEPGQAIREDTPGYIPKAFPKLFPHGTGDFHSARPCMRDLKFEDWGRYVMTWHDGRFMRHTRFRYWLLDTSLRVMTPGMQRTFFRTREAATAYTLEDLEDKSVRKNLVQQMSSATSQLPGSVGERRKMRQELENMVHQLEAETADNGENGGAGRMPAGFCTLTCPVYKWHQLHEAILKSLPSAAAQDCNTSQIHEAWKDVSKPCQRRSHEEGFL